MTNAFQSVINSLKGTRDAVLPSIQSFPPLDIPQVARELRLKDRAEQAAEHGRPPGDAVKPDAVELEVRAEIETRARKATEDYRSQVSLYEARIRRALISHDQRVPIEAAARNVMADFEAHLVVDQNTLARLESEVQGHQREFDLFREKNGLWRLPRIVSHEDKRNRVLFLMIIVLVETFLNATLFAAGAEGGIIEGAIYPLAFSALNVGAAYLCAVFALPYIRHRNTIGKLWGVFGTLLWAMWLIVLNLALAHYRDLFVRLSSDATEAVQVRWADWLGQMTTAPIAGIEDSASVILGFVGLGLGIAALVDAFGLRDPYPEFEEVGRRRANSIDTFVTAQHSCIESLRQLRDEAVDDMKEVIDLVRTSEYDLRLALEGRTRLHRDYASYFSSLESAYERLVREYRETNTRAREKPPPQYFAAEVVALPFLQIDTLPPLHDLENDVRARIVEIMEKYIREINDNYRSALPQYATVAELTAREHSSAAN